VENSANRTIPDSEKIKRRHLRLMALAGPSILAAIHVLIYVAHRAMVGTAPAEVPGEFVSLVILLLGLQILLYRRGTSLKLQIISAMLSVVWLAVAPVAGFVMIVLVSAK
jgi:hypothetical protein